MKKEIYLFCTIVLGLLLSFLIHLLFIFSLWYSALQQGIMVDTDQYLFHILPIWSLYTFPLFGIVIGYFLGQRWWQIVYVERRHWRMKNTKEE